MCVCAGCTVVVNKVDGYDLFKGRNCSFHLLPLKSVFLSPMCFAPMRVQFQNLS